jgi:hypothetical protein
MKKLMIGLMILAGTPSAFADDCSYGYRCGAEYWDKPHRAPQPIQQPTVTERVMGSCGEYLPLSQSYQARPGGVSCGSSAAPAKKREPLPVPETVMERWDILSRSGRADAQQEMQKVRQQEQKWSGQISIPMQENWTFTEIVGDYADRCGYESFATTCYKDREEQYTYTWETDVCTRYEEVDDSPSPSFGGSSSGSSSPYSSGSPSRSGGGMRENRQDHRRDSRDSWGGNLEEEYKPVNPTDLKTGRFPASRRCVSWGKERHSEKRWRSATRLSYSCMKQRPKWCVWPTTSSASRACKTHVAKYSVNYEKDPQWQPGFVDPKDAARRSYIEILPNRWDLLLGESEIVDLSLMGGQSVVPGMKFRNGLPDHEQPWNEYSFKSEPQSVACAFNMAPEFKIGVLTHGRILQAAPNPLRVPKDALKFNLDRNNRPEALELNDNGRGTRLKAAQNARNLGRSQGTDALYKDKDKDAKGTSASGGYWEETRFKIQMFRKDAKGREVRVTVKPESYSYDQVDVFDDAVTISLEGKDGTDRFYRPGGPMEFIFGRLYRAFNIELTPGQSYFIRVRVVSRGLPFYDSGCTGGKAICKGEEGTDDAYSEPIDIPFTANPAVDKRSWFKKFRDWQERRLWL